MKKKYEHVLNPIRIGKHVLKNRIIAAPVTLHSASNGEPYPTESAMKFFVERAKAGAGLVVCAGVKVLPVEDDGLHTNWNLYKHNAMHRLAELAERIHFYGAKASMELIGIFEDGYVASEGGLLMDGVTPGREIPVNEMMRYKEGYAHSAEMLMKLGYDGILLHFGHGIPMGQFLSPLTNKRTDQYGGSFENRVRYIIEILKAIRERVGDNMIIEIRMSADEFKEGGIDIKEGIKIAEVLQEYADIIQASCGMITPDLMCRTHPCDFYPPMPNVYLAEALKQSGKIKKLVTAIGGIGSLEDADEIIASGKADFVAISRAFIADPELIRKSVEGRPDDVVPCIKCMRCHDSTVFGNFLRCSVNPTIGMLHCIDSMIVPPKSKKKVAVIGGGPGGIYAALTASKRGHSVTLYEKTDSLGGNLKFASKAEFKYSLRRFMEYLIKQVKKSNVKVELNRYVLPEDIKNEGYDAIIVAVGSEPLIPPIPGVEHTVHAIDLYGKEDTLGDNLVIIGGGQIGCETALHLARLGKKVTILEMRDELAPDASVTYRGDLLSHMNKEPNLTQITSAKCTAINLNSIVYERENTAYTLDTDSVILAAGMKPRISEGEAFVGIAPIYWVVGDCVGARNVEAATREGYFAGVNI